MRILVIDDCKEDRELISKNLKTVKTTKITIDECNCLNSGITKIQKNTYDVILLDLALPESDGVQTIQLIQNEIEKKGDDTPIVILTGLEDYEVGKQAFTMGIKDFLIKGEINTQDLQRSLNFATFKNNKLASI